MTNKTIRDVYLEQDASDMFFNHEGVVQAYTDSLLSEDQRSEFISQVRELLVLSEEDAAIIVDDFLARV